jgi:hypothetical protein
MDADDIDGDPAARLFTKVVLRHGGTETYKGFPHGMPTEAETINSACIQLFAKPRKSGYDESACPRRVKGRAERSGKRPDDVT